MTALLKAADLTPQGWHDVLAGLHFPADETGRLWAEAPDGWTLDYWHGLDGEVRWCGAGREPTREPIARLLPRLESGRLFAPSGELRWRLLPALGERCYRVVFLGEQDWNLEALTPRSELSSLRSRREWAYLWGRKTPATPDAWIELRIPHRFVYPVEPSEAGGTNRVQAELEIWTDARGEMHYVRLCDLKTCREK